jgi:hypothetical protein
MWGMKKCRNKKSYEVRNLSSFLFYFIQFHLAMSLTQTIRDQVEERLLSYKLERIRKEAVVEYFRVL